MKLNIKYNQISEVNSYSKYEQTFRPLLFTRADDVRMLSNKEFQKNNKEFLDTINSKIKEQYMLGFLEVIIEGEELPVIDSKVMGRLLSALRDYGYDVVYRNGERYTDKESKLTIKW